MNKSQIRIAERRHALVTRAAAQRLQLGQDLDAWRRPLAIADKGMAAVRFIKSHPAWMMGGVVLPGLMGPTLVGKWMRRGWFALQVANKLRRGAPAAERMVGSGGRLLTAGLSGITAAVQRLRS